MKETGNSGIFRGRLGSLIRKYRQKGKMSQERLAEKADIHRTYVSDIELGKVDISITVAYRICQALNISLSLLIKEAEKSRF